MTPHPTTTLPAPVRENEAVSRPRLFPPHNVLIMNDADHSMEFVVGVLQKVFGYGLQRSFGIMMNAHETGCAVVWTGPKEVAEFKAEQIGTFHEKSGRTGKDLGPLGVRVEPAE